MKGRFAFLLPIGIFAALALILYVGLFLNPREIPSALIGSPVPEFTLPAVKGRNLALSTADLKSGEPTLVNVFASWCVACRSEHPLLVELKRKGEVPVHGLNYKDEQDAAAQWLDRLGDPYTRTGADISGRVGIDFGVYGVPETFVVAGDGRIVCKHIGPVQASDLETKILPIMRELKAGGVVKTKC